MRLRSILTNRGSLRTLWLIEIPLLRKLPMADFVCLCDLCHSTTSLTNFVL